MEEIKCLFLVMCSILVMLHLTNVVTIGVIVAVVATTVLQTVAKITFWCGNKKTLIIERFLLCKMEFVINNCF